MSTKLSHDEVVRRLRTAARATDLRRASDAFLASVVSAPLRYRTVLAHRAYVANMPEHRFTPNTGDHARMCRVCGATAELAIDEGDIREGLACGDAVIADVASALVDLESFADLPAVTPAAEDMSASRRCSR